MFSRYNIRGVDPSCNDMEFAVFDVQEILAISMIVAQVFFDVTVRGSQILRSSTFERECNIRTDTQNVITVDYV